VNASIEAGPGAITGAIAGAIADGVGAARASVWASARQRGRRGFLDAVRVVLRVVFRGRLRLLRGRLHVLRHGHRVDGEPQAVRGERRGDEPRAGVARDAVLRLLRGRPLGQRDVDGERAAHLGHGLRLGGDAHGGGDAVGEDGAARGGGERGGALKDVVRRRVGGNGAHARADVDRVLDPGQIEADAPGGQRLERTVHALDVLGVHEALGHLLGDVLLDVLEIL
jgi:hypothetical protein